MPEPETLEPKKYLYDKMFYKTKYFVIWRNNFDFEKGRKIYRYFFISTSVLVYHYKTPINYVVFHRSKIKYIIHGGGLDK